MNQFLRSIYTNRFTLLFLFCLSLVSTFFTSRFSYLYGDFNPWLDVNIYYTLGKGIYYGLIPYKDLFDHKGPIIFFIYYLGYLFTPNSFQGMFLIQTIFLFVELVYITRLAYLFLPKIFAITVPCIFSVLLYMFTEEGGSAEEFILVFIIISFFYFVRYLKSATIEHSPKITFLHGVLMALVFFSKLNLVTFWFIPILAILIFLLYKKRYRNFFQNLLAFLSGVGLILFFILFYFSLNHAISAFWESYFTMNSKYKDGVNFLEPITFVRQRIGYLVRVLSLQYWSITLFIVLAFISFFFFVSKNKRFFIIPLILTFFIQYLSLVIGSGILIVLNYYLLIYLTFVPLGICLLVYGFYNINTINNKKNIKQIFCYGTILICICLAITSKNFYNYSLEDLKNRNFKDTKPFYEMADFMNKYENNDFINLGFANGIDLYTLMNKLPNVRFFFTPNISYHQYPILFDTQEEYLKSNKIKFVITQKASIESAYSFKKILKENNFKLIYKDSSDNLIYASH